MSLKIKAIAGAAAAAVLSAGVVVSAPVTDKPVLSEKEAAVLEAIELRKSPGWRESFEEALLEGKCPTDPVAAAWAWKPEYATRDDDKILTFFLNPTSVTDTEVTLTLVHDDSDGGYNLWSGRFVVDDVSDFAATFTEPYTMDCKVQTGAAGTLINKSGYSTNYTTLSGKFTYLENGKNVVKRAFVDGYGTLPTLNYEYSGSGKLIGKTLYFYLHRGDDGSPLWDVALIHVVDKKYAESVEYAALPYGDLIDCYTYVEPSEPSEAAPERN